MRGGCNCSPVPRTSSRVSIAGDSPPWTAKMVPDTSAPSGIASNTCAQDTRMAPHAQPGNAAMHTHTHTPPCNTATHSSRRTSSGTRHRSRTTGQPQQGQPQQGHSQRECARGLDIALARSAAVPCRAVHHTHTLHQQQHTRTQTHRHTDTQTHNTAQHSIAQHRTEQRTQPSLSLSHTHTHLRDLARFVVPAQQR
jgi:hypothetical protein